MDPGEQTTGTRDEHYNLISILYHALEGADTCDMYALDAEASGRADLYEFFREAQLMQTGLAEQAKELLGISSVTGAGGVPPGAAPLETDVEPLAPPEGELPPEAPPEGHVLMDTPLPEEDVAPPGEVPPGAPRTEDIPPRTGDAPPSPSEPPPPTDVPSDTPREAPPAGEERPERRGEAYSTDAPREAPPPGEERPGNRTP